MKPLTAAALVAGAALLIKGATMTPRGIRNNNPGNIRKTATAWKGLAPDSQQTDPAFFVFLEARWGIRAINRILDTYEGLYGLHTVRGIISRWAPPIENNTAAYINAVAAAVGKDPDEHLTAADRPALVAAIIHHENGRQPYAMTYIREAIGLS